MEVEGWLSVKQAASELETTFGAVYNLVKVGRLGDWTIGGMRVIRRADLDAYKASVVGKNRPGPKRDYRSAAKPPADQGQP